MSQKWQKIFGAIGAALVAVQPFFPIPHVTEAVALLASLLHSFDPSHDD